MSGTGKYAVAMAPLEPFEVRESPVPDIEFGTAFMRVELGGVCATDVHYWKGDKPSIPIKFPCAMGHEIVGIVEAQNHGYETDFLGKPVRPGDRIVVAPLVIEGNGYWRDVAKLPVKEPSAKAYGHLGDGSPYHHGGYGEYLYIFLPGSAIFKTDLPAEEAVFLEPTSIAVAAIDKVRIFPGETVVIQGTGPIGLLSLMVAREAGAAKTIVVGGRRTRLDLAKKMGADIVVNRHEFATPEERVAAIKDETLGGYGADVVIATAGVPDSIPEGIDFVRYGGRFCEAGHFADSGSVMLNPSRHFCSKSITLVGSWSSEPEHFARALAIMERREYPLGDLISHRIPVERTEDAFRALASNYLLDDREVIKAAVAPWD